MPPAITAYSYMDTLPKKSAHEYPWMDAAGSPIAAGARKYEFSELSSPRKMRYTTTPIMRPYEAFHPPLVLPSAVFDFFELNGAPNTKPPGAPRQVSQPNQTALVQPDIDWQPDRTKYHARVARNAETRSAAANLKKRKHEYSALLASDELPAGFPKQLNTPSVWKGDELKADPSKYIVELSAEDIAEAEEAVKTFQGLNKPMNAMSQENFPLPTLGPKLVEISKRLDYGVGFFVLRGFEPKKYSSLENVILYTGIASYVASQRGRQDENANMLLHLVDLGKSVAPDDKRQAPYSNVAQPYHSDLGEVIGLYALDQAVKGGRSKLASCAQVYNHIADTRPDLVHTLIKKDWIFDRFGQTPKYVTRPILYYDGKDQMSFTFSRRQLTGSLVSPRSKDIPPMTELQAEALDKVHFSAEENCLFLECRRGDMQFWNNLAILHAREAFTDAKVEEGQSEDAVIGKRHLLRLWLKRDDSPWKSPYYLQKQLKEVYDVDESIMPEKWPIEPIKDYVHVTTQKRSSGHG